jgi:retron-type reverse transcriptase
MEKSVAFWDEVRWIVEADIVSFFDSLDRTELKKMLEVRVADGSLMRLIGKCLHVGVFDGEALWSPQLGTVQGSVFSPLLGNVYERLFGRKGTVSSAMPLMA